MRNTSIGSSAGPFVTTGSNNTLWALCRQHVRTANNVICIGANVVGTNVSNST